MQKKNTDCSVQSSASDLVDLQAAAVKATANAVVITDWDGTVTWVDSAFEQLTGYTHAETAGQSTRMLRECGQTPDQLEILRSQGCDQAQGYLFNRALGAEELGKFIREWNPEYLGSLVS
jgi:PAS domain-containing protein